MAATSAALTARCRAEQAGCPRCTRGPSVPGRSSERHPFTHDGSSVTCPRPVISMTSPALDIEGDAGHSPETGITAKDHIDAFACDDEGSALTSSWSGDIPPRPQVLSHCPGSCVKGYCSVARHERCRNRREIDLRKARRSEFGRHSISRPGSWQLPGYLRNPNSRRTSQCH